MTITAPPPPVRLDADGTILIGKSGLRCDVVLRAFLAGDSAETIAYSYPSVTLAEVYATIAYYLEHRAAFDEYLERRSKEADEVRRQIESRPGYADWRERLLERARLRGFVK